MTSGRSVCVGDGLETVGRIADDRELRPLMEHLSQARLNAG